AVCLKNWKREICTSGSVRDEDGQPPHLLMRLGMPSIDAGRQSFFGSRPSRLRRPAVVRSAPWCLPMTVVTVRRDGVISRRDRLGTQSSERVQCVADAV